MGKKHLAWLVSFLLGLTFISSVVFADTKPKVNKEKDLCPGGAYPTMRFEYVSMTDKAITTISRDETKTFTIIKDTKFISKDGKLVERKFLSLKKGDDVLVMFQEEGSTTACGIREGGSISFSVQPLSNDASRH